MSNSGIQEGDIIEALRSVYDPEIPINIYDLGLIYEVVLEDNGDIHVKMTLTSPNCPEAQLIPDQVRETLRRHIPGAKHIRVELVWDPPWTAHRMSEDARLALGM